MPTIRATRTDLLARVERRIQRDVNAAAGNNALVSRQEQKALPDLLNDVANDIRTAGGVGARVNKDALVAQAIAHVENLLASVNQGGGSGAAFVSAKEVKALLTANPPAGARVAKAYELITGRRVIADAPPAPSVTGQLGHLALTAARLALISDNARRVAGSGDLMTGGMPAGNYIVLHVLQGDLSVPQGRSYAVYIPHDGFTDPMGAVRMYLEATDGSGVTRTASFDTPV